VHAAVRHRLLTRPAHTPGRRKDSSESSGSSAASSKCDRSTPSGVKAPVEGGIWTREDVAARGLPVCLSDVVATQLAFGGCVDIICVHSQSNNALKTDIVLCVKLRFQCLRASKMKR